MPLGAVITGANANDGKQAGDVLDSLVIGGRPRDVDEKLLKNIASRNSNGSNLLTMPEEP